MKYEYILNMLYIFEKFDTWKEGANMVTTKDNEDVFAVLDRLFKEFEEDDSKLEAAEEDCSYEYFLATHPEFND